MQMPLKDAQNTETITCCHVLEGKRDVLYASHDEEDGMWQFLCGEAHKQDDGRIIFISYFWRINQWTYIPNNNNKINL